MIIFKPTSSRTKTTLKDITEAENYFTKGLRKALFEIGLNGLKENARKINNDNRTGKVYFVNDIPHTASSAGQSPSNRTGKLKRGYGYHVRKYDEVEIGNIVNYAKFLELGTRRIEKRPTLVRTMTEQAFWAWNIISETTDNAIKRRS